ncbi:TetR/AcrR family transcriptional regulator [Caballeronia sp. LP006]|jgi:AcrR family transcriptional regulator|uniref:TetR family transcriptional regulator n=1 Tax=unclassified Caballeronia TaxID=2646786 RepID=UPI001FD08FA0|nr:MULTISPECIES: TetR family transcriptional regulator [unclassified Caballeronia]MDR5771003.1 TetR/AcrR family transcriptional regulator [Caballeronia sp. LZ002]MDR5802616.1 TetR/AcrR family transcriptional regulator [Caballeronia sp. LZ001]MDR5830733.1 TetR/AcrR family transcriptional regulator [Caballeronia sp. LP006]MDR5846440.1 TetR/AcrR family transcriptional regulator [Caballeronia sp. LZ003]
MKKGSKAASAAPSSSSEGRRKYDPEETKRNILDIATQEFSAMGLTGARVDAIAERTNTTKRMLYYYFGSKDGLYEAVLEQVYGDIRALEQELRLEELDPEEAMREFIGFTFDYHDKHRDFVRLVTIENVHGAKYIEQSKTFKARNSTVIKTIEDLIARGVAAGRFREDIDPIDLHLMISSFCFHRVANRHTWGAAFGRDPSGPRSRARHREMIIEAVLRFVRRED